MGRGVEGDDEPVISVQYTRYEERGVVVIERMEKVTTMIIIICIL